MVKADLQRAYDLYLGNPFSRINQLMRAPGVFAVLNFRFGHWLNSKNIVLKIFLKPVYILLYRHYKSAWGIDIDCNATIGPGLFVYHYGGIIVGSTAVLGRNCSLSHGVTIGMSGEGRRRGCPVIGDDVFMAPGSIAHGKITIGSNVKLGPNTVINRDVPDNSVVSLGSMRIVSFPKAAPTPTHVVTPKPS